MTEAKKITISLPLELYDRLQLVKERFNISFECKKAIEREVYRQELLMKGGENMENVIKRLAVEKEDYDEKYKQQGYEEGYEAAKGMEYEELVELTGAEPHMTKAWEKWCDQRYGKAIDVILVDDPNINIDVFLEGWLEGVQAFFDEVKDQL